MSLGAFAGWKALSLGSVELMTWWGIEYSHYIETETTFYPGFGASIRATLDFPIGGGFELCAGGGLQASKHQGGPYFEDPSTHVDPFSLIEFYPVLAVAKYF
jgi:hypothetical protein